jgi:hypothetical protein
LKERDFALNDDKMKHLFRSLLAIYILKERKIGRGLATREVTLPFTTPYFSNLREKLEQLTGHFQRMKYLFRSLRRSFYGGPSTILIANLLFLVNLILFCRDRHEEDP